MQLIMAKIMYLATKHILVYGEDPLPLKTFLTHVLLVLSSVLSLYINEFICTFLKSLTNFQKLQINQTYHLNLKREAYKQSSSGIMYYSELKCNYRKKLCYLLNFIQ